MSDLVTSIIFCYKFPQVDNNKLYKVLTEDNDVLALKQVNLKDLHKSQLQDYINEVKLLRKLQGKPGIIGFIDYEIDMHLKVLNIVYY